MSEVDKIQQAVPDEPLRVVMDKEEQAYLETLLNCGVCGGPQRCPKLLTCLHSFCQPCLLQHADLHVNSVQNSSPLVESKLSSKPRSMTPPGCIVCPTCSKVTDVGADGVESLKDNLWLCKMSEKLQLASQAESTWVLLSDDTEQCKAECDTNRKLSESEASTHDNIIPILNAISCHECRGNKIIEACQDIVDEASQCDDSQSSWDSDIDTESRYYCGTCDVVLCGLCRDILHGTHTVTSASAAGNDRKEYLNTLLGELSRAESILISRCLTLDNAKIGINAKTCELSSQIKERADSIITTVTSSRDTLLDELTRLCNSQSEKYVSAREALECKHMELCHARKLTNAVLHHGDDDDILHIASELSTALMSSVSHSRMQQPTELVNLRFDAPMQSSNQELINKAFGNLVKGVVQCGDVEKLQNFNIDLNWPTGLAVTKDNEFVITGKTGAFDKIGKVLFYNHVGQLMHSYQFPEGQIPYDTTVSPDGEILVTNNAGQIIKFTKSGTVCGTFDNMFKGTGRLTTNSCGHILVCSSDEHCVHVYDKSGKWINSIPEISTNIDDSSCGEKHGTLSNPHYITTNHVDAVIVSSFSDNCIVVFDASGNHLFTYSGAGVIGGGLKCPSAVCCDPFDNILIADFTNDHIHLVSSSGTFLGYLLGKEQGLACPNCLTMDSEGRLLIGQYGGDVTAFNYLSYMKFV